MINNSKVIGQFQVDLTEYDVESIIITSFEGGSNYWMGLDNTGVDWKLKPSHEPSSMWATKLLLEGKEIKLFDVESHDGEEEEWVLTLEKLIKGVSINHRERPFDSDLNNMDATTADCIIQYALFDEVVYG